LSFQNPCLKSISGISCSLYEPCGSVDGHSESS
jgi:hypothetical protein